jgi:hypothetical protein
MHQRSFAHLRSVHTCAGLLRAAGLDMRGQAGASGGAYAIVYGLVQKSGKIDLLTKAGLQ